MDLAARRRLPRRSALGTFALRRRCPCSRAASSADRRQEWAAIGAGLVGDRADRGRTVRRRGVAARRRRALVVDRSCSSRSLLVGAVARSRVLGSTSRRRRRRRCGARRRPRRRLRAPRRARSRRRRRLRAAVPPPRPRPRQLARARPDAHRLRRPPLRARPGRSSDYVLPERLPPPPRLRRPARRRLARDRRGGVRAGRRRGARPGRPRHPRRSRAVPVRALDAGEHARGGARARDDPAAAEARRDGGPAGGPVRRARALVGERARRRSTRRSRRYVEFLIADGELDVELEIDPGVRLAPGRADRGVPDRPGGARQRAQARGRAPSVEVLDRRSAAGVASCACRDDGVGFEGDDRRSRAGPEEHASARGIDRRRLLAALVRRARARRSRSCCAPA